MLYVFLLKGIILKAPQFACEMTILDADPPMGLTHSLAVDDIDGDGNLEMVVGGLTTRGGCAKLMWYRPATGESGVIVEANLHVGLALEDIDGDGLLEVVAGDVAPETGIFWFKPQKDLSKPWQKFMLDSHINCRGTHDLLFADVDGDGVRELIANDMRQFVSTPTKKAGVYIYKPDGDVRQPWRKHCILEGNFTEGMAVGDVNGDGVIGISAGTFLLMPPAGGAFSGKWEKTNVATSFREMCRNSFLDVTGNGRMDIVMSESEYQEGQFCWFENRMLEDPENPWVEHEIDPGERFTFAHSMDVRKDEKTGNSHLFVAEMAAGGWNAPRNEAARLLEYVSSDKGKSWQKTLLYMGQGTHMALMRDVDNCGEVEFVGKEYRQRRIQVYKKQAEPSVLTRFNHKFIDRDKNMSATDMVASDLTGDGLNDLACGKYWYKNGTWERFEIPGIAQVIYAADVDGDGRDELIATKGPGFSNELVWVKPVDAENGKWEEYAIGLTGGDWPHGCVVAPVLPGGKLALVIANHSAYYDWGRNHFPEIFEVPDDPKSGPWVKRTLGSVSVSEQLVVGDINGNGLLDIVSGPFWFENMGDGNFVPHRFGGKLCAARSAVMDVNGNGLLDIVVGEQMLDFDQPDPVGKLAWFENPGGDARGAWKMHVMDNIRCPHSLSVADMDGDGELEVVAAEHYTKRHLRSSCRLFIYKKADKDGKSWVRYPIDDRFEHHDGAIVFDTGGGKLAIASHGWVDNQFVHLWEGY